MCIHVHIVAYVCRVCMCVCMRVCVRACVCICVCVSRGRRIIEIRIHACMCMYVFVCSFTSHLVCTLVCMYIHIH